MSNLKAKLKKEGGFTLIEMLIVIAIIAILIAIGIPMVNKALERAREAADSANERSALGLAMVEVLSENKLGGEPIGTSAVTVYYTISTTSESGTATLGKLVKTQPDANSESFSYGKGTAGGDIKEANAGKGIKITYTPASKTESTVTEESFKVEWDGGKTASGGGT